MCLHTILDEDFTLCDLLCIRLQVIASSHVKVKVTFYIMPYRVLGTTLKELYTLNIAIFDSI